MSEQLIMTIILVIIGSLCAHLVSAAKADKADKALMAEVAKIEAKFAPFLASAVLRDLIKAVDDAYAELNGPAKWALAEAGVSAWLVQHGIPLSAVDIQAIINAILDDLKLDWGQNAAKAANVPSMAVDPAAVYSGRP